MSKYRRLPTPLATGVPADVIKGNFFKLPNSVVDGLMHCVSAYKFAILMAIWRQTVGYGTDEARLSLTTIQRLTGVSRECALGGLRFWVKAGLITRTNPDQRRRTGVYRIAPIELVLGRLDELVRRADQSSSRPSSGRKGRPELVDFFDPNKERLINSVKTLTPFESHCGLKPWNPTLAQGATIPDPDPWKAVKERLAATMNRQSYNTWIKPTWL